MSITEYDTRQGKIFIDADGKNTCGILISKKGIVKGLIKSIVDSENTIYIQGKYFCAYKDLTAPSERYQTLSEFLGAWSSLERIGDKSHEREGFLAVIDELEHGDRDSIVEAVHENNKRVIFSMLSKSAGLFEKLVEYNKQFLRQSGSPPSRG